jgi:hypothetical protein
MFNPFTSDDDEDDEYDEHDTDGRDEHDELTDTASASPATADERDGVRRASSYQVIDPPADHRIDQVVELLTDPADGVVTRAGAIARITRQTQYEVQGFTEELDTLLRQRQTALIGVDHHTPMLHRLAENVGLTLAIAPHKDDHVSTLCRHLSALVADDRVSGLGSARRFEIPVSTDPEASESSRVLHALENHQGDPLHHLGNDDWDVVAFTAPEQWVSATEETLSAFAPVVDRVVWDQPRITVCGFVFEDDTSTASDGGRDQEVVPADTEGADHTGSAHPVAGQTEPTVGSTHGGSSGHGGSFGGSDDGERPVDGAGATATGAAPDADTHSATERARGTETDRSPAARGDRSTPTDEESGTDGATQTTVDGDAPTESSSLPEPATSTPDEASSEGSSDTTDQRPAESPATKYPPAPDSNPDDTEPLPTVGGGAEPESETASRPAEQSPDPGSTPASESTPQSNGRTGSSPPADTDGDADDTDPADADIDGDAETDPNAEADDTADTDDHAGADNTADAPDAGDDGRHGDSSGAGDDATTESHSSSSLDPDHDGATTPETDGAGGESPAAGASTGSVPDESSPAGDQSGTSASSGPPTIPTLPSSKSTGTGGATTPEPDPASSASSSAPNAPAPSGDDGRAADDEECSAGDDTTADGPTLPPEQIPSPPGGTGPGLVPAGDAPASQDPGVVDIDEHVLNEISSHAVAHDGEVGHDGQEVYATLYCNDEGLIRHSHIVEDERFLEKRRSSISFKKPFYRYVRHLAQIYGNISHRLCGDVHSHPSGIPKQSPADKAVSKHVWNNPRRNHNFIIALDDAAADDPDQWTVVADGKEVQKRVNGHLLRIRAFAGGTNEPKQIRVHTTMGL